MIQRKAITRSWGIGLSNDQVAALRDTLGDEHELMLIPSGALMALDDDEVHPPVVLWVASKAMGDFTTLPENVIQRIAFTPRAVLLDEDYTLESFEKACDLGFSDILRPPLQRERVADVMRRAMEMYTLHYDMECMAREIVLERELLERKNEILSFLVEFLTSTAESFDILNSLNTAFTGFSKLLPMQSMHAVLWGVDADQNSALNIYIGSSKDSPAHLAWCDYLLKQARSVLGKDASVASVEFLDLRGNGPARMVSGPDDGVNLSLPLIYGQEQLGVLVLSTSIERHLGRDQAMALDSAMRHFSLSLKNARHLKRMQQHADFDALTGVHSRRHFDERLTEEYNRSARYDEPLSVIMLDIDLFKAINDSRGHHVGDITLQHLGKILNDTVRASDYCARYGGEEFIVLLPHTAEQEAYSLAERIRRDVEETTIIVDGGEPVQITVSLGISCLNNANHPDKKALICSADAALYRAKECGRNCTVSMSMQANKGKQASALG